MSPHLGGSEAAAASRTIGINNFGQQAECYPVPVCWTPTQAVKPPVLLRCSSGLPRGKGRDRQFVDVLPQPPGKIRLDWRGPGGIDLARRVFALSQALMAKQVAKVRSAPPANDPVARPDQRQSS